MDFWGLQAQKTGKLPEAWQGDIVMQLLWYLSFLEEKTIHTEFVQ